MNNGDGDAEAAAQAWVAAEACGDAATISTLLSEDFTGTGPLGFVLTRAGWLDRHASTSLRYTALTLGELQVREHGDHAVAVARQTGEGAYRGHPDRWRVAHVHTSLIAGTPGAPPIPGPPSRS